jgi:hypothetical protein
MSLDYRHHFILIFIIIVSTVRYILKLSNFESLSSKTGSLSMITTPYRMKM